MDGSEGPGWGVITKPGTPFARFKDSFGVDASRACCVCGGGKEPRQCAGKVLAGTTSACACPDANCYKCALGVQDGCGKCKNGQYLHAGRCVAKATCTGLGKLAVGSGLFGRQCKDAQKCEKPGLAHFAPARPGIRLKGAGALVLLNGKVESVENALECANRCLAAPDKACKAFELKARAALLRCNLLGESSATRAVIAAAPWDLYERIAFCV